VDFYVKYRTPVDVGSGLKSVKIDLFADIYINLEFINLKNV
jgi:hypothetical protein